MRDAQTLICVVRMLQMKSKSKGGTIQAGGEGKEHDYVALEFKITIGTSNAPSG